jgi:hypothetical protein
MVTPVTTPPQDSADAQADGMAVGAGIDFTDPNSALAPFYLRASQVTAVAILAVVFVLLNYAPLWHTDIWGHLKFGQWIVQHARLPERDPFCPYATEGDRFIHYSWLSQAGLYAVYHLGELLAGGGPLEQMAGGVAMLRFSHALLEVLRLTILLIAFRRLSGSWAIAVAGLIVVIALGLGSLAVLRPQVVGELGFALVLLALSRACLSRRALVLVPLVLVLWANAHGSYPAGLMLLAVTTTGQALESLRTAGWRNWKRVTAEQSLRRQLAVFVLSLVALALLNPSGPWIYANTLSMARNPNVLAMDEWQPLPLRLGAGGQWAFLATLVLLAGTRFLSRQRLSWTVLLLTLIFAGQALLRQRLVVWWLVLCPWIAVRHWPACVERVGLGRKYASVPSLRKTLAAGVFIVLAFLWSNAGQWVLAGEPALLECSLSGGTPWRLTYQLAHPHDAGPRGLPALQNLLAGHYPGGRFTGCLFASETLGDLPLWDLAPEVPVFIYTHVHLFPPEHWERCRAVRSGSAAGQQILDQYHINLVLVESDFNARLCALLRQDQGWRVVLDERDDPVKRDPRQRLFIAVRTTPR